MTKAEKILQKILGGDRDKNVTLAEAEYALLRCGFVREGGKGSHRVYRHADGRKMVIPAHGRMIKPIYVKILRGLIQ